MPSDPWARAAEIMSLGPGSSVARYRRRGDPEGSGREVRVILSGPDRSEVLVQGVEAVLHVVRSQLPEPVQAGDQFAVGEIVYSVHRAELDEGRVTWVLQCMAVPEPSRAARLLQRASKP
ncbi:hypothetical protein [Pseudoroseomonas cervicalis]|uniref:head-tail joining protein n=1 Tax=Teichococcus cervicalis TaxID=204525 RepID=UPI002783B308|nr:hypothetical protein [Pseudoroseomonas cervicalis]MDQ1079698.1 hypothetical protein [Pseudoroseomonas cervicalis]